MPRAKPQYVPEPRVLNEYQVAARLGKSQEWFRVHRPALEAESFPRRDGLLDGWDSAAIERWLDSRAGFGGTISAPENPWDRARHGKRHAAVS